MNIGKRFNLLRSLLLVFFLAQLANVNLFCQDSLWMQLHIDEPLEKIVEFGEYIWISGNGLIRLNKKTYDISKFNKNNSEIPNNIADFAFDKNGILYISANSALSKFENNKLTHLIWRGTYDTAPVYDIFSIAIDKHNVVWSGWEDQLFSIADGIISSFEIENIPDSNYWFGYFYSYITTIDFEKDFLWLVTSSGGGVCKFEENNHQIFNTLNSDLLDGSIFDLAIDSNGVKWFCTKSGLIKFDDQKWEIFNEENSLLSTNIINSISVDKNNKIWLGTDDGLYSIASEWRKHDTNNSPLNSNKINDVFVSKDNSVWVTTNQKSIYRFLNIIDTTNYISKNYKISQNYPNPFNLSTTIEYSIPATDFVNLTVYDILGKKIAELINEQKPTGNYEIEFDGSKLSSGIYFYQINTSSFTNVKKMIFLK